MAKLGEFPLSKIETEQGVFDIAAKHLLTQMKVSVEDIGLEEGNSPCAYNGDGDLCCAAAPFIENYSYNMEGKQWGALVKHHEQPEKFQELIRKLQLIHDTLSPTAWDTGLKRLAKEAKLEFKLSEYKEV